MFGDNGNITESCTSLKYAQLLVPMNRDDWQLFGVDFLHKQVMKVSAFGFNCTVEQLEAIEFVKLFVFNTQSESPHFIDQQTL